MKMNKNKVGATNPVLLTVISVVVIFLVFLGLSFIPKPSDENSFTKFMKQGSQPFGDVLGLEKPQYLNWLSFILGEVPNFLVAMTSKYSAVIVTVGIFIILIAMFGDILETFGNFGRKEIAWAIAVILTIIAVNFKVTMLITAFFLSLVAGLGAISVGLGIALPFLIYFVLQFGLLRGLKQWYDRIKGSQNLDETKTNIKSGLNFFNDVGASLREKGGPKKP